jgi:signal transduction histidine kinase/ActR/RegA family two-component response regulator
MSESIANPLSSEHPLGGSADAQPSADPGARPVTALRRGGISVVRKLTLLVGLTLALLLAVLVTANGLFWRKVLHKAVDTQLSATATNRRDMIKAQMAVLRERVELDADRGELRGLLYDKSNGLGDTANREWSQSSLNVFAKTKPIYAASLVDPAGIVLLSSNPQSVGRDVSAEPVFKAALTGPAIGAPQEANGQYSATLGAPLRSRTIPGRVDGILLEGADVSGLARILHNKTGLGESGEAIMGVRAGDHLRLLFQPGASAPPVEASLDSVPALAAALNGTESLFKYQDSRGVPVLAVGRTVGYGDWGLVVRMDAREAYRPIVNVIWLEAIAGSVVMLIGVGAAYLVALSFTRSMRALASAANRVVDGDYETSVPVKSTDEFGALATSFNEMTTAIRRQRTERDQAEMALRDADRRKDEFLAMLGHELRNPLSAIANAVRLWSVAGSDPGATDLARSVIERQTGNLSRMVDDLLDVARITAGKIELRKHPVDVNEAIRRVVDAAQSFLGERHHELELALDADAGLYVDADATRLEQIVTNLLTNAIKYTRKGGLIRIETRREEHDAVITVTDNGIGIAPRMLPQIFELFAQGDRSLDRTTGGLGIGLNLCRRLAELHGGTITAASEGVGRGSTFTVRLPAITAPSPGVLSAMPADAASEPRHRRILLVDDNQDTVHSLARLLVLRGHQVATAFDGVAALKVAEEFQPDFPLLDLGLPGLDGYEVARRLRAGGFPETPIVAISGYAQENDRLRSREAGFNFHFSKPVDFDALAELILENPPPKASAQ